jgi:hypothetical protein
MALSKIPSEMQEALVADDIPVTRNYAVSDASAITVATYSPTAIAAVTLTTTGGPVLLIATGDANPLQNGGWHWYQFYRGSTAIGKKVLNENAGLNSINGAWANSTIDVPSAGTYSYQIRAWRGTGDMIYGETGNIQAPTICAVELVK